MCPRQWPAFVPDARQNPALHMTRSSPLREDHGKERRAVGFTWDRGVGSDVGIVRIRFVRHIGTRAEAGVPCWPAY